MHTKQILNESIKVDNKRQHPIVWIAMIVVTIVVATLLSGGFSQSEPTKPGLYDEKNRLIASWDTLVNKYGMDVEVDYRDTDFSPLKGSPSYVLTENKKLSHGTKLIINDSVSKIGAYAFRGCDNLTKVIISDSVTTIGRCAFNSCERLTTLTLGNNVTSIGDNAFSFCENLTGDLVIPDSVTTIDFAAFSNCVGITSVTIGKNVKSITTNIFSYCPNIESITVDPSNITYHSENNCLVETATNTLVAGYKHSIIPDGITTIGDYAFSNCTSLTNITIPDSVTTIGNNAFDYCSNLTSINIPDSITTIGGWAFDSCTSLTSIIYAGTVEQWHAMSRARNWHSHVPATEVACVDGTVNLS